MTKTKSALKILEGLVGEDPDLCEAIDREEILAHIAQLVFDSREQAAITRAELAALVGAAESEIAQLEEAVYEGNSLAMLNKVAKALNKRLEINFVGG